MSALRLIRTLRSPTLATRRAFTVSSCNLQEKPSSSADGSTPQTSASGQSTGDAFAKREQASENLYVRQQLQAKLEKLRKGVKDTQDELDKKSSESGSQAGGS